MSNKIGRFEILGELSHSEMGFVYKASDPESGQTIALKTVRLQMLGEQSAALIQRILEEANGINALNSQSIAMLYGIEEIEGQLCSAMEYVQGNSIATMLARKEGFSIWDLQDVARQTCQALDHAHARNVVHYSLEPAKVMVAWDGTVKILSFGISSMSTFACQASGKAAEVLRYMSPEQLRGEPVDARSNLFSLGVILYEMVTERRAFPGEDADQVQQQILKQMPPAPERINRKLHPVLSEVIMKALAKAPEARYQSGKELENDLERCKESATKTAAKKSGQAPAAASAPPKAKPVANPVSETGGASSSEAQGELGLDVSKKAAAAAAGWGSAGTSSGPAQPEAAKLNATDQFMSTVKATVEACAPEQATASPAAAEPVSTPWTVTVDPMMAEGSKDVGSRGRSFSEIDELPPLKEVYVPPAPPEPVPQPEAEPLKAASLPKAQPPKPKVQPRQAAKKAVAEIKKTPPKLFGYSIIGALIVIAAVIMAIAFHIHSESAEDEGSPAKPTAAVQKEAATPPAAGAEETPGPAPAAVSARAPEHITADTNTISVTPKYNKRKTKTPPAVTVLVPGQLTINSTPEGAEVRLDGRNDPSWVTPFNISGLAPGQHTVSVGKAGYATENRAIEVASGSKSFLVVQLAQAGATVAVAGEPAGAAIFIDGKDTGRLTPAQIPVEKPGTHTLLLKKQGYLEETATANLQPGQVFHFSPALKALGSTDDIKIGGGKFKKLFGGGDIAGMGAVSVKTQPKGAQVAVNNRIVDKASPVEFHLNPGTYVVDITMSGYKSIHRVIDVEKGGKVAMDETLERE